jgi:hypothetical protein
LRPGAPPPADTAVHTRAVVIAGFLPGRAIFPGRAWRY